MVIEIEKALKQKPVTHWIDALNDVGVPCAPINTIDKLFDHPQLLSRDMIVQVEGPSKVPLRTAGNPIKMHGHEDIDVNTLSMHRAWVNIVNVFWLSSWETTAPMTCLLISKRPRPKTQQNQKTLSK